MSNSHRSIHWPSSFFGTHMTHDQCWEMYWSMLEDDANYDFFESGRSQEEALALQDVHYAHMLSEHHDSISLIQHPSATLEALTEREAGYEAMIEAQAIEDAREAMHDSYYSTSEDESLKYHETHHHEPEPTPHWLECVTRIERALTVSN